jgi:hypothetical protein
MLRKSRATLRRTGRSSARNSQESKAMKIVSAVLLLTAVILTFAIAEQIPAATGWCRVYASPDRQELRLFYADGRYAYVIANLKKHKNGTAEAEIPEGYSDRTGSWKMTGEKLESHEFWVHTGGGIRPNPPPTDEYYSFKGASNLLTSRVLHLHNSIGFLNRNFGSEYLTLVDKLTGLKGLQNMVLADTCEHAKESPHDVAQEWMKFCTQ